MWNAEGRFIQKRFEYRLETIQLLHSQASEQALVACLNEWGEEGWLICQIDLGALHTPQPHLLKVLLVRSLSEPVYIELNSSNDNDDDDDFDDD